MQHVALHRRLRSMPLVALALLSLAAAAPAQAVESTFNVLLNVDVNPTTGCDVTTVDGVFEGAEHLLVLTVETGVTTAEVTRVERQDCIEGTGLFDVPVLVSDVATPVDVGLGLDGSDRFEACVPLADVTADQPPPVIRLGVTGAVEGEEQEDALLVARPGTGQPILMNLARILEIPTLSQWAMILLALLLGTAALAQMRRHRRTAAWLLVVVLLGGAGVAWAVTFELVAEDGTGDAPAGADLRALFAGADETEICFQIDAFLAFEPPNDPPVADDQVVTTDEDVPVVITLTGSDSDTDPLTFAIATGPANGTLSAITPIDATSAQVTYTPNADFNGADSFTFTVNDGTTDSVPATVSITVDPVNDAPVADAQMVSTAEDTPVVITLTGSDVDGDSLTFAIDTAPANGTLGAITPIDATSAQVTYTPDLDFNGADSFTFTVNDGTVTSAAATVSITVTEGNDAPVADAQAVTTDEDVPVVITLTGSDLDGDPLTFAIATGPANGTLGAITPIDATSAQVTYTPNADFNGADSFTFTVNDGTVSSAAATVSITVDPVNDAPVANAQAVTTDEDTPVVITLTGSDVDGDPLTFAIDTGPANGSLSAITPIDATSAQVTYTPNADFNGADSFTFTVNDGTVSSAAATVSITVDAGNDAPVADAQAVTTDEDMAVVITLTGSDVDGDSLTFAIGTGPTNGTLGAITPIDATSAQVTYTPNANFNGADSFTFTVNDGTVSSAAATVSITVDPVQDPPTANAQMVTTDEDVPVVITLTGADLDGDSLTFAIATGPANGTLGAITPIDATSAQVTYTPNGDFNGADSFTFTVNDGTVSSAAATVSITVDAVNDAPLANDQAVATDEETPVLITLTGSDVDGEALTFAIATGPTNGTLSAITPIDATSAEVTYTPNGDFNGADSFTFTVNDGTVSSAAATVSITVNAVNDPPTATGQMVTTDEDTPVVIVLTGADVDGDALTFAIATGPTNGSLGAITPIDATSAQVTYTPNANFFGADSFTFTVNDGTVTSAAAMVNIMIESVPDPPLAGDDAFSTVGNVELVVAEMDDDSMSTGPAFVQVVGNVLANDSDPVEGTPIMIVELQGDTMAPFTGTTTEGGSVTLQADGSFVYTPEAGDRNLVDTFTYVIRNGVMAEATGTVEITIVDELLWFVKNTTAGGTLRAAGLGDGTSSDPFSSLSDPGTMNDAEDVSVAGESILVFLGDGSSTNQDQGITLEANQKLFGHSTATLLLGGITVQTPAPGARPKIDNVNAAGDGVTITDATGVEVTGLDISGTDNAVQIRTTIAGTFTANVHDNTISDAGGHGIDGLTTDGELRLALDANTGITAGGSGVLLDGTGGGSLFVTSFGGNEVDGATATDGLSANGVIFDADPSTPGFEEVMAGVTVIGSTGDPVAGDGLELTAVKGNLHFTQLDVFNTGGVGIQAVGDTSGGTGFELSVAAGQVESTGDSHGILLTDVGIDPGDDFLLSRIVSTGSVRGVELLRVLGGDFSIVDGGAASSLTSSGEAIRVEGGTSAVTFSGVSATRTTPGGAAISGFNHDGSFIMSGGTITHTGGRVIDFDDMDGGSDFTGTTVSTTNHHGKRLVNSAGTHTFPAVVINTAPPALVDALHLENNTGTTNVGGLSVTTNGSRGLFASNAGTLNLTGLANQITTTGHSAIEMANTTIGGSGVTFTSISASTTGANEGIDLDNVSGATFQVTGTVTVNTTTGGAAGIDVAASSAPVTLGAVDIDLTAGAGIALTGNSGTVTINGGDINAATGVAFDVNGGSGNVTYGGTIRNTVDNAVEITGRATAGRTVTLSNNITHDNGAGGFTNFIGIEVTGNTAGSTVLSGASKVIKSGTQNGVHLVTNTGHTIQFTSGGLDIDTTSGIGFNATGGGTVEAVGAGSSIVSTTGTALNVVSTNIGAGDLTFQSISAGTAGSGPGNGIVLSNTGSLGGLTVTGNGGSCTEGSLTCTGGHIQNVVGGDDSGVTPGGTGIVLNNTANVSLTRMRINDASNYGIRGTNVVDFTFAEGVIDGANGTNVSTPFNDGSMRFDGLTGTSSITNSTIRGGRQRNIAIDNSAGTLNLTINGNTIKRTSDAAGDDGFHLEADTSANVTVAITNNTFARHGGDHINLSLVNNAVVDATITGNTLHGNYTGTPEGNHPLGLGQGIFILGATFNGTFTYDVSNNGTLAVPFRGNRQGGAIHVNKGSGTGTFSGSIENNVIGDPAIPGSGSSEAFGIIVGARGAGGSHTTLINNNTVREYFDRGVVLEAGEGSAALNATVTNNTVSDPADAINSLHGIHSDNGILVGDTNAVCLHVSGNSVANAGNEAGGGSDLRLRRGSSTTVRLPGLVGSTNADATNHLQANNPTATTISVTGGSFSGGAACPLP